MTRLKKLVLRLYRHSINEMSDNMNKQKNIPINVVEDVYNRLSLALGDKPIIIGGRAVNILCSKDARPTNDIDLIIKNDPETRIKDLIDAGFFPERDKHGKITALHTREYDIKIDLYYSRSVNNIPIEKIEEFSDEARLKRYDVKVAPPSILLIMKLDAGREQDMRDVKVLLQKYYDSRIEKFLNEETKLIEELGVSKERLESAYYLRMMRR